MKKIVLISLLIFIFLFILSSKCKSEPFANSENNQMMWDGKISTTAKVIENLKKEWSDCGFSSFELQSNELSIINSRKRLIELLPVTKMIGKLDYEKIRCFINKYDPENYVVISKTITNVPKVLKPLNVIIVNNMLYQSTPYGVLKYQIPKLSSLNNNTSLNASIEAGIINEYNVFNMSNHPIYVLEGKLLQKRNNKILDLKNKDEYIFSNINNKIELLNKNISDKPRIQSLPINVTSPSPKLAINIPKNLANIGWLRKPQVKERMTNIEEMAQLNKMNPDTFLPIVQIKPGQKIEDIKKAAKEAAAKKVIEITIMKAKEQANKELQKAKENAKNNPKALEEAEKKVAEINKAAKEIVKKETSKTDIIKKIESEVKIAKNLVAINPNDPKAKKALEEAEKKVADIKKAVAKAYADADAEAKAKAKADAKREINYIRPPVRVDKDILVKLKADKDILAKKAKEEAVKKEKEEAAKMLVQTIIIKDIEKAEKEAKIAVDFALNNPKDPKAKKIADDANKKYEESKKLANDMIKKLVDNKTISKQNNNELVIKINEIDLNKLLSNLVSVMEYDGVVYICQHNSVKPLSFWAIKLNEIMNKNKFTLLTVIPHYYYLDNKFNFVLIFVFNDDFCVMLNKENLSEILDIKSVLGISFNPKIPDRINCDDIKVILEQMTKANVITSDKSKSLLKRYKC